MVGSGVSGPERSANFAYDSSHVGEKIVMQRRGDQRCSVLRAEYHVGKKVRIGVRHLLSPLRGLEGFYSNSSPTAYAMGYDLSPALPAAKLGRYCNVKQRSTDHRVCGLRLCHRAMERLNSGREDW